MAGRRARRGVEPTLDSLLDTMANVTGILVVLLAVTQISMGDAMGRLREVLVQRPELTRESLAVAEREAETLRAQLAGSDERRSELELRRIRTAAERASLERDAERLQDEIDAARGADPDALRRRARELDVREGDLRRALAAERDALVSLRGRVEALEAQPLRRSARLPDPRPAPAGAREIPVLCRYGRVLIADERLLIERLGRGVDRALAGREPGLSLSLLSFAERIRLSRFFEQQSIGAGGLRWKISERGELDAALVWSRKNLGEDALALAGARSDFRRELGRTSTARAFLRYVVWADSFDAYAAARRVSDDAGFAAGWSAFEAQESIYQPLTRSVTRRGIVD